MSIRAPYDIKLQVYSYGSAVVAVEALVFLTGILVQDFSPITLDILFFVPSSVTPQYVFNEFSDL